MRQIKRHFTKISPYGKINRKRERATGRSSARLERTVRVREAGGSNPPAPTERRSLKKLVCFTSFFVFKDIAGGFISLVVVVINFIEIYIVFVFSEAVITCNQ